MGSFLSTYGDKPLFKSKHDENPFRGRGGGGGQYETMIGSQEPEGQPQIAEDYEHEKRRKRLKDAWLSGEVNPEAPEADKKAWYAEHKKVDVQWVKK